MPARRAGQAGAVGRQRGGADRARLHPPRQRDAVRATLCQRASRRGQPLKAALMAQFFIDRPIFAWVIALSIILGGILVFPKLPVSQYPEVAPPALQITVVYPGASSKVVEDAVTSLIEQEMNGIEHLLYMESSSDASGTMTMTLTFATGTNLDIASVEAQNRLGRVAPRLPDEVRRRAFAWTRRGATS